MVALSIVCFGLLALNLIQTLYWLWQTQRLVDKIMSRSYAEFVQTEQLAKSSQNRRTQPIVEIPDDEVLQELNSRLGGL